MRAPLSFATFAHRALRSPEVRERIAGFGFEPVGNSPEEFGEFVKADIARWAKVAKESGARID